MQDTRDWGKHPEHIHIQLDWYGLDQGIIVF